MASEEPALRNGVDLRAVATDALPAEVDVAIVGGGIVGVSAALLLARRNISSAVFEKGVIGGEQSGRNWGWCRVTLRDAAEIPLMRESMRLWSAADGLGGLDTGFRTSGIMYLCGRRKDDVQRYEAWLEQARAFQLDSRMLSGGEVAKLLPGAARGWSGALYTPSDGCAEPGRASAAIAEAARTEGAGVVTACAVRGIETEGGRVAAIVTERGRVRCRAVLVAAGAWSRLFCGNLGVELPQLKVLGSVMRTGPISGGPEVAAAGLRFGFHKRADGGYTVSQADATIFDLVPDGFRLLRDFLPILRSGAPGIRPRIGRRFIEEWRTPRRWPLDAESPFEQVRVLSPAPSQRVLEEAARHLAEAFPAFRSMRIAGSWGGLIDVTPDALPVISAVDTVPGLYIATGFSGHGFGIGPAAGRLASDLIAGHAPVVDPAPFRLSRFARARPRTTVTPSLARQAHPDPAGRR